MIGFFKRQMVDGTASSATGRLQGIRDGAPGPSVLLALLLLAAAAPAMAAKYSITYHEWLGPKQTNLFNEYRVSGTATFEIRDSAISPNALVLFTDDDFLAFEALMDTTIGTARFALGEHDFPPRGDDASSTSFEQGIRFDGAAEPRRFDTPASVSGSSALICAPSCGVVTRKRVDLGMWDDDAFADVYLNDGTITGESLALANGDSFTRLGGDWWLEMPNGDRVTGVYEIQPVPLPGALWLMGGALVALLRFGRFARR